MYKLLKADLHIHPDKWIDNRSGKQPHGEDPKKIARALLNQNLNVAAITPHNEITPDFLEVREEVKYLLTTAKFINQPEPSILLGVEVNVDFEGKLYHVVTVFRDDFNRSNLPKLEVTKSIPFSELIGLKDDHNCIFFVAHPFWKDKTKADARKTRRFIRSDKIAGFEASNGSVFHNILTEQGITRPKEKRNKRYRRALKSLALASEVRIRKTAFGNSDSHRAHTIGTAYTEYLGEETTATIDLFEAIKTRSTIATLDPRSHAFIDASQLINREVQKLRKAA